MPTEGAGSPLEAAAGTAGSEATAAFSQLANETRLAILLALWEAYEPFGDDNAVRFSTLYDRVGIGDSGNFSYHLEKLTGHFVRRTGDGYELSHRGRKLVRAVIAGTGLEAGTVEPTPIDRACPHCGAPTAVAYEDEWLYQVCTACPGTFKNGEELRPGTLTVWPLDQAALAGRTATELFVHGAVTTMAQYATMIGGVCPACSGTVRTTLDVCESHDPTADGACGACGRRYPIQARFVCTVCKNKMWGPPSIVAAVLPRVTAFFADRGIDIGIVSSDLGAVDQLLGILRDHDVATVASTDPLTIALTFSCAGDELRVVLDDSLAIVSLDVHGAGG